MIVAGVVQVGSMILWAKIKVDITTSDATGIHLDLDTTWIATVELTSTYCDLAIDIALLTIHRYDRRGGNNRPPPRDDRYGHHGPP